MPFSLLRNQGDSPLTLPAPFKGIIEPGGARIFALSSNAVITALGGPQAIISGISVDSLSDSYAGAVDSFNFVQAMGAYDIAGGVAGRPADAEVILLFPAPRTFTLPAGLASSQAVAGIGASVAQVFSLRKNGVQFGTLSFAIGALVGVFTSAVDAVFAVGQVLTVVAPTPPDVLLADVGITLAGQRTNT